MKKTKTHFVFLLMIIGLFSTSLMQAHDANEQHHALKHWQNNKHQPLAEGSFYMYKNGQVFIEDAQHHILKFSLNDLSKEDKLFVLQKQQSINQLNQQLTTNTTKVETSSVHAYLPLLLNLSIGLIMSLGIWCLFFKNRKTMSVISTTLIVVSLTLFGFKKHVLKLLSVTTNPTTMDAAFIPFKPNIHTFWDATYFYVESNGIPTTHTMMVGISNHGWQQQVPISQCYIGSNAWPIPLNPVISATPVPVNAAHFSRGAIAVAVNGVAIFNPYTNTGVDAYLDGQLDNYGGHCGRADDYHYHTAPMHLYSATSATLPIAYALDGFAVYGSTEPNGTAMQTLDANHGHYGTDGVYHYHGSAAAPYMIANMVGQITEDATHQIIPQAAAQPVRPSLTPLTGALIISCIPNTNHNGYNVTYTKGTNTDSVVYSWTNTGVYTYKYYTAGILDSTKTYNKSAPCTVPNALNEIPYLSNAITIYPNPTTDYLNINLNNDIKPIDINETNLYNLKGELVYHSVEFKKNITAKHFAKGVYLLKVSTSKGLVIKKIIIE